MDTPPIKVLLVDDDEDDYFITSEYLADIERQQYKLDWVDNYADAFEIIARREHDIYLIDYRLGVDSGLNLLRDLAAQKHPAPMILLTGQGDHDVDVKAMQAGAADYLLKGGINPQLLERSIRYALERKRAAASRARLENQLLQSQKMDAIGQMAGGIAHDFNNVLTVITSYAGVAKRQVSEEHPAYSRLVGIEETVQRAAHLTRQLLAFASRQFIAPQIVDLNGLVLNLGQMLRRLISANIEFNTIPADDPCLVKADPGQLEQVLINLVVNARDAMPDGGTLTIETQNISIGLDYADKYVDMEPGDYVFLAVSDTGQGMPESVRAHIFEPFFTTKEEGKGTGLGLATCYGIIKQSAGHIQVYSEENVGTTFKIYLPRIHKASDSADEKSKTAVLPTGAETILLAEDDAAVRQLAAAALRQQGYRVIAAMNGEKALRQAKDYKNPIDLLISDVVMPKVGGVKLSQEMEKLFPKIKILFISGYPNNAVVSSNLLGMDNAFVQKPFSPDELIRKVRQTLDS